MKGQSESKFTNPQRKVGKKGYVEVDNPDFGKALRERFNPETDTLIIFCHSGNRNCKGCNGAIKAGFGEAKVFNFYGKRWAGGWKLEEGQTLLYTRGGESDPGLRLKKLTWNRWMLPLR